MFKVKNHTLSLSHSETPTTEQRHKLRDIYTERVQFVLDFCEHKNFSLVFSLQIQVEWIGDCGRAVYELMSKRQEPQSRSDEATGGSDALNLVLLNQDTTDRLSFSSSQSYDVLIWTIPECTVLTTKWAYWPPALFCWAYLIFYRTDTNNKELIKG